MRASYFLYFEGTTANPIEFRDAFAERFGPRLTSLGGVRSVLLYTQGTYHDPFLADDPGPFLLCRTEFDSVGALLAALEANTGALNFGESEGLPVYRGRISDEIMVGHQYPTVCDALGRGPIGAVSYFVAYPNTAGDRDDFLGYYTAHHPALLGQLPGIRATILQEPTDISAPLGLARADHMLICDVSFDTFDALNASLLSDVRKELREDYQKFPSFTGAPVHSAMLAKRLDVQP